jgi:hypothetical protein
MMARSKRSLSRSCNRLVYVDERGTCYRCPLPSGHPLPHTVVGRIQLGADTVLVKCQTCNLTYYRSTHTIDLLRCVLCSADKLELLGRIGPPDSEDK